MTLNERARSLIAEYEQAGCYTSSGVYAKLRQEFPHAPAGYISDVLHAERKEWNRRAGRATCYPSPCCGKESEYVNNFHRRCPCGQTWRTR